MTCFCAWGPYAGAERISTGWYRMAEYVSWLYAKLGASSGPKIKELSDVVREDKDDRPGLEKPLQYLREGDALIVWKLDRLGRSLKHLVQTVLD
ncbi:recombinase family protein [Comamonas endophytica]|uniref:recombinase family protein n=1 Tax=Comamonas endophytica TaxID=2949090 RepID=UPI003621A97D